MFVFLILGKIKIADLCCFYILNTMSMDVKSLWKENWIDFWTLWQPLQKSLVAERKGQCIKGQFSAFLSIQIYILSASLRYWLCPPDGWKCVRLYLLFYTIQFTRWLRWDWWGEIMTWSSTHLWFWKYCNCHYLPSSSSSPSSVGRWIILDYSPCSWDAL